MRLFTKMFLFGMLAFGLAFSVSGYFLLHYSLEGSLTREKDFALKQYQYDKFTVQSAMLTNTVIAVSLNPNGEPSQDEGWSYVIREQDGKGSAGVTGDWPENQYAVLASELSVPAAFFAEDHTPLYSDVQGMDPAFLDGLTENVHAWQYCRNGDSASILVGSMLRREDVEPDETMPDDTPVAGRHVYFVTQWDVSKTLQQQDTLRQYFLRCYLVAMAAGTVLLMLLSALLTGPLNRMSRAARRIADGDYGERLSVTSRDEVGTLAESFNQMAEAVEEKVGELAKAAEEKEDFVANFAHELKTPLTSIVGYADTIYQKELSREETRRASWHIWNEGMRLEALSLKLMELTVLGRQDFPLTELPADELLQDVAEGLAPLFLERQVDFHVQAERAYVMADYDLLKTLLINLTDNSLKAGATRIELLGRTDVKKENEKKYLVCVRDNGCGMEQEELSRITEAFYMVDKARSRKQHGAGLGLALADRVARLHGDKLAFESRVGVGTTVRFCLNVVSTEGRPAGSQAVASETTTNGILDGGREEERTEVSL